MPLNNLPPFRSGASFPPATQTGFWSNTSGSLRQLGESLKVDESRTSRHHANIIRAVPDPWAQARTFADALLDEDHSMHAAAVSQWRGLLALFALAELRKSDYSLDVRAFELGTDHPFDRLLRHLAPKTGNPDQSELWLAPHIVYLHPSRGRAVPVAMLNPASLVSPGRTTWGLEIDAIPWMRGGLSDPLALAGDQALANTQLAALEAYVRNVRASTPASGRTSNALREELQRFADDMAEKRGASPVAASVRRAPDPALPTLYRSLVLPAELDVPADPAAVSECRLRIRPDLNLGRVQGVVLVDESVANAYGRAPRDILAWGNHSLAELLDSPYTLADVQQEAAEAGWIVVTANEIFTPRIVRLRKNPKIEGHSPEARDMLEPIRPLVLLLDQDGTRRLHIERGERRALAALYLKLQTASGTTSVVINRNYRSDGTGAGTLVDDVDWDFGQTSIWPNFRSKHWTHYYARLTYPTTREQIRPQFAMSREIIEAAVSSCDTAARAVQNLLSINNGQAPGEREDWFWRFQNVSGKAYEELQISDKPFEAVFYVDFHPDRGDAPAGCVRLKLLEPAARDNRTSVAVDFGSTNTVACLGNSGGEPITFQGRIVHPIVFEDANRTDEWRHIVRWNYVDFLPLTDRETPTPTVVISRNDADRDAREWLLRNLIYFQPAGNHAKEGAAAEIKKLESYLKRSHFNLKWDEREDHVDAAADFLEQFMTMVAAEAAAAEYNPKLLDWRFSVPDAMSSKRQQSFRAQIERARTRLSPEGTLDDLYSEGLSAARYILSGRQGSKFTPGSINAILDIGGSTTDITLWANEVLVWKGSFRLAGRAYFTQTLVQNPQILRDVELGDWADLIDPERPERVPEENVADVGELLFSRPALSEAFDKHWNRRLNLKPGEGLRTAALIYLAGMAYYVGLVAKQLVSDGVLSDQDLARPAFALCGRGAGIFTRMHGGLRADAESDVTLALQTFSRASGLEQSSRPQLFISRRPKLEVAAGMTVEFDTINARVGSGKPVSNFTPAGMAVELVDGSVLPAAQDISDTLTARAARGSDLSAISDFLDTVQDYVGVDVDLKKGAGQGAFNEISTAVRQAVDRQKGENGSIELSEPPFITALAALVTILASPTAERDARLSVEVEQ